MQDFEDRQENKSKVEEVGIFTVPVSKSKINNPSKKEIIHKAIKYHLHGDIKNAAKLYQYCIDRDFNDPDIFSNYATIYLQNGDISKAIELYKKSIALFPNSPEAYSNLGNILTDIGKLPEAELLHRQAIEIKPNFDAAYYNLGNTLKDLGKLKEAEISLRKAIELNTTFAEAHLNLGNTLLNLGKLKQAEISLRKAIKIKPDLALAHSNLGIILRGLGQLEKAELSFIKAIEINPNNDLYICNLLELLNIHKPIKENVQPLFKINQEYRDIEITTNSERLISDHKVIDFYNEGLIIYKKYNLNLVSNLSQIYKRNQTQLNCKRHKLIFSQHNIIPKFCFGCYKVQVEPSSIIDLFKLFFLFNQIHFVNNNTRKCMIEMRPGIKGFYKGLIYCSSLEEAYQISDKINTRLISNINSELTSIVKRGCSEYYLKFPEYKKISKSGIQKMNYNQEWHKIEEEMDKENNDWSKEHKSIEGFNLNGFLIMRNWIGYAQKVGDKSVNTITNEKIKVPNSFEKVRRFLYTPNNI